LSRSWTAAASRNTTSRSDFRSWRPLIGSAIARVNIKDATSEQLIDPARDVAKITEIKRRAPVNALVVPALTISDLAGLGIRRVSTGSLPYRAAIDAAVAVATAVRDGGKPPTATPYPQAQASLAKYVGLIAG
jgi:2-methylisocitrate lyase-like PEP mutase family enzyme